MNKLNIGFVFDDSMDRFDGVQQYITTLAEYYTSYGHTVFYFVGETKNKGIPNLYSLSKNLKIKFNKNVLSIPILTKNSKIVDQILRASNIDVFHVQLPFSPMLSSKIIKFAHNNNIPVIGTFHILGFNKFQAYGTSILRILTSKSIRYINKIYSISLPAQVFAKKYYKVNSTILGAPVNINKFTSTKNKKNKKTILFLGRLVSRKAPIDLLKALVYLKEHNQQAFQIIDNVNIAGSGNQSDLLKEFVIKNNLDKLVNFLGYVSEDEKVDLFNNSTISVFPSRGGESFGIVLIEAMASGKTLVLAANNVGYSSVMKNLKDQLFRTGDYIQLSKLISEYITNPEKVKNGLYHSRNEVKNFDVNLIGNKILSDMIELVDNYKKKYHN